MPFEIGHLALFAIAALGHLVLLVGCHNWWYAQRLGKYLGDLMHLVHAVLYVGGVVLAWRWCGFDLTALFQASGDSWQLAAALYVAACWGAALVLLPAVTAYRLWRPQPSALMERSSQVLDTVQQLGYAPVGLGSDRVLARLPGNEIFKVEFSELTLRLPRVPAVWDGLTILHLSDLHLKGVPDRDFFRAVMDRCSAWEPDLVAITGDIADSVHHQKWVIPVLGRLRWRVAALAIFGNHDYWYDPPFIARRLKRLGIRYLGNGWERLEVRGEPLVVIGNEWPWNRPQPDLSGCPDGTFRLCLSHSPDNIAWARRAGVDLMLAGHVHGGQVRLPLIGSVFVPSVYGRRYDAGLFDLPPTILNVSRGLSGEHPLRYGCLPEVTRITLRTTM